MILLAITLCTALATWFVTWFVRWVPCHFDPIMCLDMDMPWWWFGITALLLLGPIAGTVQAFRRGRR